MYMHIYVYVYVLKEKEAINLREQKADVGGVGVRKWRIMK